MEPIFAGLKSVRQYDRTSSTSAHLIWSNEMDPGREKLVYREGLPEMKFLSEESKENKQKEFAGAVPTTICQA